MEIGTVTRTGAHAAAVALLGILVISTGCGSSRLRTPQDSGTPSDASGAVDTTYTSSPTGTADPTLLPLASNQTPAAQAPGGSLAAGASYQDPITGVRVYKVTDPSKDKVGAVSSYASGGPYISQPWTSGGKTYYTLIYVGQSDGGMYFVDFCYDDGTLSNYRNAPASGVLKWAWSYNPATPRIGYYLSDSVLHRYDTQAMTDADRGHFPKDLSAIYSSLYWLSVDKNDRWFSVSAVNDSCGGAWDAVNDIVRGPYAPSGYDEPHLDKNGNYLYVVHDRNFGGYSEGAGCAHAHPSQRHFHDSTVAVDLDALSLLAW